MIRLTFDGEYLFDGEIFGKIENPGSRLCIGSTKVKGSYFDGFIDEVRISNKVRYKGDYKPPKWSFRADNQTLALWHFDQATGFFTDSSGNGNTLIGMGVGLPVEPAGRLSATWGKIKSEY